MRRTFDAVHPADELFLTEFLTTGIVLLDQPVGEAHDPVSGSEDQFTDPGLVTAEADRERRRAAEPPDNTVSADQQGAGCPALAHWTRPVIVSNRII